MMKWTKTYDASWLRFLIADEQKRIVANVPMFGSDEEQTAVARIIEKAPEMRELLLEANTADLDDEELGSDFFRRVRKLLRDIDPPEAKKPDPAGGPVPVMKIQNIEMVHATGGAGGNAVGPSVGRVNFHDRDRESLLEVEKQARSVVENPNPGTMKELVYALKLLDEARTPSTQEIAEKAVGSDLSITPDVRSAILSNVKKALDAERERPR